MYTSPLRIAIAGSTHRTTQCADTLLKNSNFSLEWILTPEPKVIGKNKTPTPNPLHQFADTHTIPCVTLKKRISNDTKKTILTLNQIDILLVVDFGYLVPDWLLALPRIAPLNIHPSALPKWRGSSPGQYCLLYDETTSAITIIVMNNKLDQGPLVTAQKFTINPKWDSEMYYQASFDLLCTTLPEIIRDFATHQKTIPQPLNSPTVTAERIEKNDAYIPWEYIAKAQAKPGFTLTLPEKSQLSRLLSEALTAHPSFAHLVAAATRALSPWPKVWTIVPTQQGEKRMQLHQATVVTSSNGPYLELTTVQIAGKSPALFNQVKNIILE